LQEAATRGQATMDGGAEGLIAQCEELRKNCQQLIGLCTRLENQFLGSEDTHAILDISAETTKCFISFKQNEYIKSSLELAACVEGA
jgi:hypothetical protein